MFRAARHAARLIGSVPSRRSRLPDDAQALTELETDVVELPGGLEINWLGGSGYRLTHEGQTLYIDPYLSRVPLSYLLRRRPALPDRGTIDRFLSPEVEAGSWWGTRTGATRSTPPRSRAGTAAVPMARVHWRP